MHRRNIPNPRIGKYILDTISIGMYNNPLMVIREYIQNSTDSIDELLRERRTRGRELPKIEIFVDGFSRSLIIKDNGVGVSVNEACRVLHNLGESIKKASSNRGFRGIGRLGGLGYCDELKFVTKARGESVCTVSRWDCKKLRQLISEKENALDVSGLIKEIVEFSQDKYKHSSKEHFFTVEMHNVKSTKDILLDVPAIKSYLSQVAPVPFNFSKFSFAKKIDKELRARVPFYETYRIFVNGEQVYKPYANEIRISQENKDQVKKIEFKQFQNGKGILGFGWIAELQFLGVISPSEHIDGIRLRSGNIQIGDKNILSDFFRESRFNNYVIGEIHITDTKLILNSRRDNFEDNYYKEEFYNSFVKEIGIPASQRIREASRSRSEFKREHKLRELLKDSQSIARNGYLSGLHYKNVLKEFKYFCDNLRNDPSFNNINIEELITTLNQASHYLDKVSNIYIKKEHLKTIFDVIYKNCTSKTESLEIIKKILSYLDRKF